MRSSRPQTPVLLGPGEAASVLPGELGVLYSATQIQFNSVQFYSIQLCLSMRKLRCTALKSLRTQNKNGSVKIKD
jgi:hypothetical protein